MKPLISCAAFVGVILVTACSVSVVARAETRSAAELAQNHDVLYLSVAEIERRTAAGDLNAQAELAARYGRGDGLPQNVPKALDLLRQAAEKNNPDAAYYLGLAYVTGTGVSKNEERAVLFFETAADQGHAAAQYVLGNMIAKGEGGIEANWPSAFTYFWHAADSGYPPAEFMLGYAYQMGFGTPRNFKAAAYWYRRTNSRMPNSNAEDNLSTLIHLGVVEWQPGDPKPADAAEDIADAKK